MKRKVTAIFLANKDKNFLLQLRDNKFSIPYPNKWSLLGGHVEKRETLLQALKREIKEEINYDIHNQVFIGSFDDLVGNIVYVYKSKINKKLSELKLTEGQKLGYFSFDEILNLNLPGCLKDFIIRYKKQLLD